MTARAAQSTMVNAPALVNWENHFACIIGLAATVRIRNVATWTSSKKYRAHIKSEWTSMTSIQKCYRIHVRGDTKSSMASAHEVMKRKIISYACLHWENPSILKFGRSKPNSTIDFEASILTFNLNSEVCIEKTSIFLFWRSKPNTWSASATLIWGSKTARQAQIIFMDAW